MHAYRVYPPFVIDLHLWLTTPNHCQYVSGKVASSFAPRICGKTALKSHGSNMHYIAMSRFRAGKWPKATVLQLKTKQTRFVSLVYSSVHVRIESIYRPIYLSIYLSIYPSIHLSSYLLSIIYPSIHRSIDPSIHRSIDPSIHQSINPSIHRSSIHRSIDPSIIYLFIYRSIDLSIFYLSICLLSLSRRLTVSQAPDKTQTKIRTLKNTSHQRTNKNNEQTTPQKKVNAHRALVTTILAVGTRFYHEVKIYSSLTVLSVAWINNAQNLI